MHSKKPSICVCRRRLITKVGGLAAEIKSSLEREDFLAWRYNTIGVSDGITQGNEGQFGTRVSRPHLR